MERHITHRGTFVICVESHSLQQPKSFSIRLRNLFLCGTKFIEYMIHNEALEAIQDYIHISSRTAYMEIEILQVLLEIH